MRRALVAPPLRYVGLNVQHEEQLLLNGALVGSGYLLGSVLGPTVIGGLPGMIAGLGGALVGLAAVGARQAYLRSARKGGRVREVQSIDVVPWGIILDYEVERHPVPWPRISSIGCVRRVTRKRQYDDRELITCDMTFVTESGKWSGSVEELEALTLLPEFHGDYAHGASRRVALALEGPACLADPLPEGGPAWAGAFGELRRAAEGLLRGPLEPLLTVPAADYRSVGRRAASPELVSMLGRALTDKSDPDRGPIAAIIAAELDARELLRPLLDLVLSPHALLCAVARGAARRLGAQPLQTGAFDEIMPFLPEQELHDIEGWSKATAPGG